MINKLKGKSVYISGKITGDPGFKEKFQEWRERLVLSGAARVINPCRLLDAQEHAHTYEEYMEVDLMFVRRCEAILMLPCWVNSPGAQAEHALAVSLKKEVVYAE